MITDWRSLLDDSLLLNEPVRLDWAEMARSPLDEDLTKAIGVLSKHGDALGFFIHEALRQHKIESAVVAIEHLPPRIFGLVMTSVLMTHPLCTPGTPTFQAQYFERVTNAFLRNASTQQLHRLVIDAISWNKQDVLERALSAWQVRGDAAEWMMKMAIPAIQANRFDVVSTLLNFPGESPQWPTLLNLAARKGAQDDLLDAIAAQMTIDELAVATGMDCETEQAREAVSLRLAWRERGDLLDEVGEMDQFQSRVKNKI